MTQTIYGGKVGSELLPAGHVLTVTLDAGAGAQVQRIYGGSVVESASLAASTSYGPYLHDMQFRVSALAGATVTLDTAAQTAQGLNAAKTAAADSLVSAAGIPGAESITSANSAGAALFGVGTASTDTANMSYSRAGGNALVLGHDGYFYAAKANELRMTGSRRVENLLQASEALESSLWTKTGGIAIGRSSKFGSRGRKSLRRITVTGSGQTITQAGIAVTGGGRHLVAQMLAFNNASISIVDDGTSAVLASSSSGTGDVIFCALPGNTSATVRVVISLPPGTYDLGELQLAESCTVLTPSEYVARDVFAGPRFNGSFADGVEYFHSPNSKGCRVEPGHTNTIRQSRNLAAAQWSAASCNKETVNRDSPYRGLGGIGNQVSRIWFSDVSSASRSIAADWQGTLPADNTWVCGWMDLEPGSAVRGRMLTKRKDGTFSQAYFNFETLTVGTLIESGGSTPAAWIWRLPNGLIRIVITHNVGTGATAPSIAWGFSRPDSDNNNVSGTQEVFIHQAQLSSEINSSPIITTSAAATRSVDALSVNMVAPYGVAGGFQVSLDYSPEYPSNYLYKNQWYYLWYSRSDANNRLGSAVRPGPRQAAYFTGRENNFVFDMYPNSATWDGKHYLSAPTINPGSTARVVSGLSLSADGDGSECRLVVNDTIGTQAGTATTSNPATLPTSIQIGSDGAGNVYHPADYMNIGLFGDLSTTAMLSI